MIAGNAKSNDVIGAWNQSSECSTSACVELKRGSTTVYLRNMKMLADGEHPVIEISLFEWLDFLEVAQRSRRSETVGALSIQYLEDLVILRSDRSAAKLVFDLDEWLAFLDGADLDELRSVAEWESALQSLEDSDAGDGVSKERKLLRSLKRRRRRRVLRGWVELVRNNARAVLQNVVGTLIGLLLLALVGAAVAFIVALLGI